MKPFSPLYELPRGAKVRAARTKRADLDKGKHRITERCIFPSGFDMTFDLPMEDCHWLHDLLVMDLVYLKTYLEGNMQDYAKGSGRTFKAASEAIAYIEHLIHERIMDGGLQKELPYEEWARNRPRISDLKAEDRPKAPSETDSDDDYNSEIRKKDREFIEELTKNNPDGRANQDITTSRDTNTAIPSLSNHASTKMFPKKVDPDAEFLSNNICAKMYPKELNDIDDDSRKVLLYRGFRHCHFHTWSPPFEDPLSADEMEEIIKFECMVYKIAALSREPLPPHVQLAIVVALGPKEGVIADKLRGLLSQMLEADPKTSVASLPSEDYWLSRGLADSI
jgi:hypothetical protein